MDHNRVGSVRSWRARTVDDWSGEDWGLSKPCLGSPKDGLYDATLYRVESSLKELGRA